MAETETVETTATPEVDYKAKFEEMEAQYAKVKSSFDKASSEVAEFKRKERERMSEDEKKTAEDAEKEAYYKGIERKLSLAEYAAELDYIADTKTKAAIIELLVDGKIVEALAKHKEWRTKDRAEMEKTIRTELLKENPQPSASSSTATAKTREEIMAIKDTAARQKAIAENLSLFQ